MWTTDRLPYASGGNVQRMARPSPRAFFNNWTNPRWSWGEKLRLAVANTAIKLRNRSNCCGNHGEPGC